MNLMEYPILGSGLCFFQQILSCPVPKKHGPVSKKLDFFEFVEKFPSH